MYTSEQLYEINATYVPQLGPESLARRGIDEEGISALQSLFHDFNWGPIETVIPALPVYAATVDATGRRAYD